MAEFKNATAAAFGGGWLWVTWKADAIQIVATTNADAPARGLSCGAGVDRAVQASARAQ